MQEPSSPAHLWDFARQLASEIGSDWKTVLDPIGLLYDDGSIRYDATPTNFEVFATTGGDGVHFGVLDIPDKPVVMVVPMAFGSEHVIVGGTLHEFLCLGCKCGYFGLEQLAYDWSEAVAWIARTTSIDHRSSEAWGRLRLLRKYFGLQRLPDPDKRLKELQRRYRDEIAVPSED